MARHSARRPVTLDTIAKRCRVAKSTVSLALRGDARVDPKTAERIRAGAAKLGYDPAPHDAARRLALRKSGGRAVSKVIGLLCQQGAYAFPFYARLLHGLLEGFDSSGFNVVTGRFVRQADGWIDETTSLDYLLHRGDLDGLIYYSDEKTFGPVLERARATPGFADRPVVSLLFPSDRCSSVLAAEEQGGARAAEHLLDLGHADILLLGTRNARGSETVSEPRWRGARAAFEARGIEPVRHLHFLDVPRSWVEPPGMPGPVGTTKEADEAGEETAKALAKYVRARPRVTAVIAQNDSAARHAWHALYRAGLRVPADVSVVGFDDTDPLPDESGSNLLTTVRMPLLEAGRRAAELVVRLIEDRSDRGREILLPTELVVRKSTATPRRRARSRKGKS